MKIYSLPLSEHKSLPEVSGIYFLSYDLEIVYVGQSRNIRGRWLAHHLLKKARAQAASGADVKIKWVEIAESDLDESERDFLRIGWPRKVFRYNEQTGATRDLQGCSTPEMLAERGFPVLSRCGVPVLQHAEECETCIRLKALNEERREIVLGCQEIASGLIRIEEVMQGICAAKISDNPFKTIRTLGPSIYERIANHVEFLDGEIAKIESTAKRKTEEISRRVFIRSLKEEITLDELIAA